MKRLINGYTTDVVGLVKLFSFASTVAIFVTAVPPTFDVMDKPSTTTVEPLAIPDDTGKLVASLPTFQILLVCPKEMIDVAVIVATRSKVFFMIF